MKYILTPFFALENSNDPYNQSGEPNYRLKGIISGQRYQYDLSDPYEQIAYEMDLNAQMRDLINPNPMIEMDRSMDIYGGGAEW